MAKVRFCNSKNNNAMEETRFETRKDKIREEDTLDVLCKHKGLTFEMANEMNPVDAVPYKDNKVAAYAEVQTFARAKEYIFISIKKLASLQQVSLSNNVPSCMVYRFNDCIGYYFISEIDGAACGWDGRRKRDGSVYDEELVVHVPKTLLKIIK